MLRRAVRAASRKTAAGRDTTASQSHQAVTAPGRRLSALAARLDVQSGGGGGGGGGETSEPLTLSALQTALQPLSKGLSALGAEFAAQRSDLAALRSETGAEFAALRSELAEQRSDTSAEFASLRSETSSEFAALRSETSAEFAALRRVTGATSDSVAALVELAMSSRLAMAASSDATSGVTRGLHGDKSRPGSSYNDAGPHRVGHA